MLLAEVSRERPRGCASTSTTGTSFVTAPALHDSDRLVVRQRLSPTSWVPCLGILDGTAIGIDDPGDRRAATSLPTRRSTRRSPVANADAAGESMREHIDSAPATRQRKFPRSSPQRSPWDRCFPDRRVCFAAMLPTPPTLVAPQLACAPRPPHRSRVQPAVAACHRAVPASTVGRPGCAKSATAGGISVLFLFPAFLTTPRANASASPCST